MIAALFNESVNFGLEAKLELIESQLVVENNMRSYLIWIMAMGNSVPPLGIRGNSPL